MNACQASANTAPALPPLSQEEQAQGPEPRWLRIWTSTRMAQLLCGVFSLLMLHSLFRTLRLPNSYSKGHWLHNYKHGFVPRGLVGELLYPIMQHKNPQEVDGVIAFIAWTMLLVLGVLLGRAAWVVLRNERVPWRRLAVALMLGIFAGSPFMVTAGHLAGYFDHIVQVLGVLGLFAVCYRRYTVAGVLCAVAILVHEMFVLTVMPALFFATLLLIQGETLKTKIRALAGLLVIPVLTSLLILGKGTGTSEVSALTADIARYGVVGKPAMTTIHLSQGFSYILDSMIRTTMLRVMRPDGIKAIAPGLVLMLLLGTTMRFGAGRIWLRIIFVLTSLTPLLMLLTVWDGDTGRMASMTFFCAFCSAYALGTQSPRLSEGEARPRLGWGMRGGIGLLALASLAVMVWHGKKETVLMDLEIDGEAMLSPRKALTAEGYRCDQLMFTNSNFELGSLQGWSRSGGAFLHQPMDRQPVLWRRRPWNEGQYWIGTFDRSTGGPPAIQGDALQGTLVSDPFVITRPTMNFLVGGGSNLGRTYVALDVDNVERYRAAGHRSTKMRAVTWDLRAFIGGRARIRIVDQESGGWGNIAADGFCYVGQE